jgi:alkylhydroperoxidase family enzyme
LAHANAYDQGPGGTFEFDTPTLLAMLRGLAATVEGMIRDGSAPEPPAEPSAAFRELIAIAKAAERVCSYDWSDNDEDAVETIDRLNDAVEVWVRRRGAAQPPRDGQ